VILSDGFLSAPAGLSGLGVLGLAAWWLAILIVTALVAAWIARDAVARGVSAPWAFALAAAFQPLLVLLVYVFVRDSLAEGAQRSARKAAPDA
jgi:hypothetical protein